MSSDKNVVLICGPYKTGTSLLASKLENQGYYNPSTLSNSNEHGHGRMDNYYLTKECVEVRRINNKIISQKPQRFRYVPEYINLEILNYLNELNVPYVLKDPLFVFTLHIWLHNLQILKKKAKVYFTFRDRTELLKSWLHAYHTRGLYNDNKSIIEQMIQYQNYQILYCKQHNFPFEFYYHQTILPNGI
jgi:hypothetical protein